MPMLMSEEGDTTPHLVRQNQTRGGGNAGREQHVRIVCWFGFDRSGKCKSGAIKARARVCVCVWEGVLWLNPTVLRSHLFQRRGGHHEGVGEPSPRMAFPSPVLTRPL